MLTLARITQLLVHVALTAALAPVLHRCCPADDAASKSDLLLLVGLVFVPDKCVCVGSRTSTESPTIPTQSVCVCGVAVVHHCLKCVSGVPSATPPFTPALVV